MTRHAPAAPKPKVVYAIIEQPPRKHWLRIGLAFVNQDGSLNVRIDALPLTGSLHIRDELQRIPSLDPVAAPSPDDAPEPSEPGSNRRVRPARSP